MSDPYLDEMMRRAKAKRDAIALTQSEVEKLARKLRSETLLPRGADPIVSGQDLRALCDHILSGDMQREIENAAYKRAADMVDDAGFHAASVGDACQGHFAICANRIRSLIQPPAQKENGK